MKKSIILVTLLMVLVLAFSATSFAEGTENLVIPEMVNYEGKWVNFEDDSFYMYLPSDWTQNDLTAEQEAAGVYAFFTSPDKTKSLNIAWSEVPENVTVESVQANLATQFSEVEAIENNGITLVSYKAEKDNVIGVVCLDPNYYGMFNFAFHPAGDPEFETMAVAMLLSINFYEAIDAE